LTENERQSVISALSASSTVGVFQVKRFSSIGPSVGAELANRGIVALIGVALLIVLFVAFAFRHVSRPVKSWKYGLIAVLALLHDVTIPLGIFAYLGSKYGSEIDALFLTALLTIMALSVSDTIVVFDRIRENLKNKLGNSFKETVGISIDETFTRSLITSLTVIFVLLVLFFFGSPTTRDFALVLTLGMFFGTYSSIFLASPLLVTVYGWQEGKKSYKQDSISS
jgi:preprotein translocase subunit SecF